MNSFSSARFQLLKTEVLKHAGIANITPSDCKVISLQITSHTKQVISETTLKRIYGFALSKFNPSHYTLDLMARYCGYAGWKDFGEKQKISKDETVTDRNVDWHNLKSEATKITEFTLQALKHRSGIPYNLTVERRFLDSHMDYFLSSDSIGTVFAAPTGYGKSIAICHWVEQQLQLNYAKNSDDIILFFSSHALMSVLHSGKSLTDWMLSLLGYGTDKSGETLRNLVQQHQHKFFLIIDGFDPLFLKKDEFNSLVSQLEDLFSRCKSHSYFKLVLTMRTVTWYNYRHEWEDGKYSWFNSLSAENEYINVPRLNLKEITELSRKMNPSDTGTISLKAAEVLSHPLYFQYYYKLHKSDFSLKYVNAISVYDILCVYIANKFYMCPNSSEKMAFIEKLVNQIDLRQSDYQVDRLKINNLIKQNPNTYQDLLSNGILREVNTSTDCNYHNHVRFVDINILDHFIAKKLVSEGTGEFDDILIGKINTQLKGSVRQLSVIKWTIFDAVKNGEFQHLSSLQKAEIPAVQKAELVNFISDLMRREFGNTQQAYLNNLFKGEGGEKLFDYFFGLELISNEYKSTLLTLLKFQLTTRQRIMVHTAIAIIAVVQLNLNELEQSVKQLASLSDDRNYAFPINPVSCLDTIFHFLKFGFVKQEALKELTRASFAFSSPNNARYKKCAVHDLLFILGISTISMTGNTAKGHRFINAIERVYPNDNGMSNYKFFVACIQADSYFKSGKLTEQRNIYNTICSTYCKSEGSLTPYMKVLFFCLKIKTLLGETENTRILNELSCLNLLAEDSGYKLSKVYILSVLMQNVIFNSDNPEFKKQAGSEFNMILVKSGIDTDRFLL